MIAEELLLDLDCKDTGEAYKALLELEKLSVNSDALYPYTERFAQMTTSDKYAVRVRGFRLFCKQARWDRDNTIGRHFEQVLSVLNDEKPTAVRQALASLHDVARYKPELCGQIRDAVEKINILSYKDTMQGLILKDIQAVLREIEEAGQ